MDNENESIDYLDKVQEYVKTHRCKIAGVALGLAVPVILAIIFSGFVELLKIVFSPQIVICGLVLYFLVTFKEEVARLIDRIKEANALGVSIKTDSPIPTPEDIKNKPQPEMKVSEIQDTEIHIGMADPGAREPINEDLIKAHQQATYWFFKYLLDKLTPAEIWLLKVIAKRPMHRLDLELKESGYDVSQDVVGKNALRILQILTGFGLMHVEENKLDVTQLGQTFLDFYDTHREPTLKDAAVALQRERNATNEPTTK